VLARGLISLVGRGHIQVYEAVRAEKRTEYVAIFAGDFFIINARWTTSVEAIRLRTRRAR
jgi:hypothetical protein